MTDRADWIRFEVELVRDGLNERAEADDAVASPADAETTTVDLRPALDSPASLHWYGKRRLRPLRKMGHVTATGDDPLATARRVRDELGFR